MFLKQYDIDSKSTKTKLEIELKGREWYPCIDMLQ